ncbi:MAG: glycosyltransferase [Sandaracinaceae bacterium]|nr:glycosyltransferase [Sandaracinaceae bacterium]
MSYHVLPVLYISYDGMLEPLGQSQVLAYLEQLAEDGPVHLISFEKQADRTNAVRMDAMRQLLETAGIRWYPLAYHKSPSAPATAFDIAAGTLLAVRIARREGVGIVHARSYVPALMAISVKAAAGAKFIFDMRGFWADERVDGGLWPANGRLFRVTKALERRFLLAADHIVTLTHASAREIATFPYLEGRKLNLTVIPTCADLERFSPPVTTSDATPFTFGYLGSVGTWYLFEEVVAFYQAILKRRPDARMLIVNRSEHEYIIKTLRDMGVNEDQYELLAAEHRDVPSLVRRMTVGAAIIKPAYSKIASAPTKLAEYLGCGVPCVGNTKVGDMEAILEGERVGVALSTFTDVDHAEATDRLLSLLAEEGTPARCVSTARSLFSLDAGVAAYRGIYLSLTAPGESAAHA